MADLLTIYNGALTELGADLLAVPTEDTSRQRALSAQWERVRKSELRAHGWKCAMLRLNVAADVAKPDFEFAYQYTLPAECLRVWRVGEKSEGIAWTLQGRSLLTDHGSPLRLLYVRDLEDIGKWDANLVDAVTYRLAAATCRRITGAADLLGELEKKYGRSIALARTASAMEDFAETFEASDMLASRL